MSTDLDISRHYSRGDLLARLKSALVDDGVDPEHPSIESLAYYDHFHGRGLEATVEVADLLQIAASDHILDIGSGIGGPSRYFAQRFGCRVTGIDLTAEFCDVASYLTQVFCLQGRVRFEFGNGWSKFNRRRPDSRRASRAKSSRCRPQPRSSNRTMTWGRSKPATSRERTQLELIRSIRPGSDSCTCSIESAATTTSLPTVQLGEREGSQVINSFICVPSQATMARWGLAPCGCS